MSWRKIEVFKPQARELAGIKTRIYMTTKEGASQQFLHGNLDIHTGNANEEIQQMNHDLFAREQQTQSFLFL